MSDGRKAGRLSRLPSLLVIGSLLSAAWPVNISADSRSQERSYSVEYRVKPDPGAGGADVWLTLEQTGHYLRELDMSLRNGQIDRIRGDGEINLQDGRLIWKPPADGGTIRWFAALNHRRAGDTYDAYITGNWALFRGEDIIPPAATRTLKGATSKTTLRFELPANWSSVTPWFGRDDRYEIDKRQRRFDTPTGWMVLGNLGVRNETIGHVHTKVAAPVGHSVRRMDMLAFMYWTLPEILQLLPEFPDRLTFVSAGAPMWRGALSAPQSVYVHADRPLISENGTSTLLHETMHVGLGLAAAEGADWIVEGLAEYYALEILRRSGTISRKRYQDAHAGLADWGKKSKKLCSRQSSGSTTARAVGVLKAVNAEIGKESNGLSSLDDVLRALVKFEGRISLDEFRTLVEELTGRSVASLQAKNLPGCGR